MVVDHHVIELYHYQAQKYQTGKKGSERTLTDHNADRNGPCPSFAVVNRDTGLMPNHKLSIRD